ncbi:hypothetical protein DXG03_000043 [Asterophora parasitica]|uniref:Uncharacterized protein n=1 Tax=Asterophora parasitica TaxID=117018 RepID=A0A9P7GKJ1_9AGAR|nr:hypothetical protein DXG03_000043 [Asterophora parasitica]
MAVTDYPLVIAQFDHQGHPRRTEHWSLVAMQGGGGNAHVFEIAGNRSNFNYNPHHTQCFGRDQDMRGGCQVGTIPATSIAWMKERLRTVEIVYNDVNFDCQDWVLNVLRIRQAEGVTITLTAEDKIREEMAAEKVRWDFGDDTVEDRLFASSS